MAEHASSWNTVTQVNGTNMGAKAKVFGSLRVLYIDGKQAKVTGVFTLQRHSDQFRLHYCGQLFGTADDEVSDGYFMLPILAQDWTLEETKIQTPHSRARVIHLGMVGNNRNEDVQLIQVTIPLLDKSDSTKSKFFFEALTFARTGLERD